MALLNFKMGLQANLTQNSPAVAPGTIYVTTDERAMYVDVPAVEGGQSAHRIRLGDFRIYATFEALKQDKTDWSQSCLYYVVDKNALARYDGSQWVLINDTANLSTAISGLQSAVEVINNKLDGIPQTTDAEGKATDKGAVKAYIDAQDRVLDGKVGAVADRATALEVAINGNGKEGEEKVAGLIADLEAVDSRVETLEGFITGGEGSLGDVIDGKIAELDSEKSSAAVESGKGLQVTVKQVDGKLTEVSLSGSFDEKYDAKGAATTAASAVEQSLTAAIEGVDTAYKAADTAINNKLVGVADGSNVGTVVANAKAEAIEAAEDYVDGLMTALKGGSTKTIKNLEDEILSNDGDIQNLQAAITGESGLNKKVSALETAVGTTIPATYETKTDAQAKLESANAYSDANLATAKAYTDALANGQVAANKTAIETLQAAVGSEGLTKRVSDLETKVDVEEATVKAAIAAAEGRAATDAKNKADAAEAAAKQAVTDLANGQVASNASAIQALQSAIGANGAVEKTIDSKITEKIESLDVTKASEGHEITVTVTQTDGLISNVAVTGNFDNEYDEKGAAAAVEGKLDTAKQNLTDAINGVSGKVDTEKARIDAILEGSTVKTFKGVEDLISSSIAANDAMVFKGVVNLT